MNTSQIFKDVSHMGDINIATHKCNCKAIEGTGTSTDDSLHV